MFNTIKLSNTVLGSVSYTRVSTSNLNAIPALLPDNSSKPDLVLHWAGSSYSGYSSSYQINICFDPVKKESFILVADKNTFFNGKVHPHTWRRNMNKIGISFICMYNKEYPVTDEMISSCEKVLEILCKKYDINQNKLFDHAYFAKIDGYSNLRWDTGLFIPKYGKTLTELLKERLSKALKVTTVEIEKPKVQLKISSIFNDVYETDWFLAALKDLRNLGIINGLKVEGKNIFKPNDLITREQTCQLIYQAAIYFSQKYPNKFKFELAPRNFLDVPKSSEYLDAIYFCYNNRIIHGTSMNIFEPRKTLTREQMSAIFFNFLNVIDESLAKNLSKDTGESFLDVNKSMWSYSYILFCNKASILIGFLENTGKYFKPLQPVDRKTFAVGLYKFISLLTKLKPLS